VGSDQVKITPVGDIEGHMGSDGEFYVVEKLLSLGISQFLVKYS